MAFGNISKTLTVVIHGQKGDRDGGGWVEKLW